MAVTAPELDPLLTEVAEARALVRMARVRLQAARLRAAGPWAEGGGRRALLRWHFHWHRHVTLAMLAHAYLAVVREAAAGGRAAARPRCGAAAADRARGAPAALGPALGAQARSGGRPR